MSESHDLYVSIAPAVKQNYKNMYTYRGEWGMF